MFDTQLIINKARNGDRDFIAHSLDLFIDFVQVFRKVLILLMQKVKDLIFSNPLKIKLLLFQEDRDNKKKRR